MGIDRFAAKSKPEAVLRMLNIHDNLVRDLFNKARAVDIGADSELDKRRLFSQRSISSPKECAAALAQGHKASRRLFKNNHRVVRGSLVTHMVIVRADTSQSPITVAVVDITVPELRVSPLPKKGLGAREAAHAIQACNTLFHTISYSRTTEGASANGNASQQSTMSSALAQLLRPLLL